MAVSDDTTIWDRCEVCHQRRPFEEERFNHTLHLIITLLVLGVWAPVWIFLAVRKRPFRCTVCGTQYEDALDPEE